MRILQLLSPELMDRRVLGVQLRIWFPIGVLALLVIGFWRAVRGGGSLEKLRALPIMAIGLIFPPLFYFVISMTGGINIVHGQLRFDGTVTGTATNRSPVAADPGR